jgi:ribonuclease P protein component
MIEVRVLASPLLHSRAGIIVPKYKHTAVERNTLKRRLRELVRLRLLPALSAEPAADVVLRAFPTAYAASFASLERELVRALPSILSAARTGRATTTTDRSTSEPSPPPSDV